MKVFVVAAVALACLTPQIATAQDAAAGETVFKRCASCHAVGEDAKNKVGPHLNDLFGRQAGTVEGFKYSQPMIDAGAGGLIWTPESFEHFIKKPRDFIKGTKMSFAGLQNEADIENLEAYLMGFSPDFVE